jgi:[ribosomal protein S18]-alanine N-acetyltransferase
VGAVAEMAAADATPDLRCEPIGPEHVDLLAALFERNSGAVTDSFDPFPLNDAQARSIALKAHEDLYYLALQGRRAVGMSMLRGFDEGYEVPSFGIVVDREHHGQGIGRQLTVWTIEQARLQDCPAVRLSVYADNAVARGLYESLGFVEIERGRMENILRPREKIIMRLDLDRRGG